MRSLAWASLTAALAAGCTFGVPLRTPDRVTQHLVQGAAIRPGEATRADVRAALGEPWLESAFWRVEVYRADDRRTEVQGVVALFLPVPLGVFTERLSSYVLVSYDIAGRVSGVASGSARDGTTFGDFRDPAWLMIRAADLTLAIDVVRASARPALLADGSRLGGYLAARRDAAECTLVAGCLEGAGCPDQLAIDGGRPVDPSPITVLCPPEGPCPPGSGHAGRLIDGKEVRRVPVLHALDVPAGPHRVVITSSAIRGQGEGSFECALGEVLYAVVRSRVVGAGWWSGGRLEATVSTSPVMPEGWATHSLALYRDGGWLVDRDLEAGPAGSGDITPLLGRPGGPGPGATGASGARDVAVRRGESQPIHGHACGPPPRSRQPGQGARTGTSTSAPPRRHGPSRWSCGPSTCAGRPWPACVRPSRGDRRPVDGPLDRRCPPA